IVDRRDHNAERCIGDKTVNEGDLLTFTVIATDSDIPANVLTFSLIDAPSGAVIDPVTGIFTWTPGEEQGPDSYPVTVWVTDDGTPNLYDEEIITITVNEANTAPVLATNTGATVPEGGTEAIDNTELQVTDVDNTPTELQFTLMAAPTNGLLKLNGTMLFVGNTFYQADIDSNLLTYEHDGSETVSDSFDFTVSDGSGGSIANTTFSIMVTPINDDPNLAANTGATVPEGGTETINNTELQVTDVDNTPTELQFILTAVPVNGLLKLNGTTLSVANTFTQADIDSNLLTYEHDGGQTVSDSFQFTVSDGSGGSIANTTFNITITEVNEPPTVALINTITALPENTDTTYPIKIADIVVTDDGFGTNVLSLSGADASLFHIDGTELFLNAGVTLNHEVNLEVYLNDPSCAAYWQFEEGALGSDSVGSNHLYVFGPEANTNDFIEGGASAEFSGSADRLSCTDSDLDPGFPMKSDGINKDITTIQWIKFSQLGPVVNEFLGKYKNGNVVYRLSAYADGRIRISSGYEGGFNHQEGDWFPTTVQTDRWYFIASTYQYSDRSYRLQIYDYTAGDFLADDLTGNFDHDINVGDVGDGFFVLSYASATFSFKGLMDACIIFNRALSVQELEDIRLGMFGEGQGNATLQVTVEVDDPTISGTPDDAAPLSITITTDEANTAPVLAAIGDQAVDEGNLLSFTAVATDSDIPANVLTFSLIDAPSGAVIDPVTGVFTWTPGEEQGPDSYLVTVRVTDDGTPNLYDQETITITVNEVNTAPVLAAIGDQAVDEGSLLTFTAVATDSDIPANVLTFSLIGAPSGAVIDSVTGVFTWTPGEEQGPGSYPVTVRVTDDGTPNLYNEETITITVNLP
ncbi:cadherin-like domain-containing protein, partial [Planctomycetota bacterium]